MGHRSITSLGKEFIWRILYNHDVSVEGLFATPLSDLVETMHTLRSAIVLMLVLGTAVSAGAQEDAQSYSKGEILFALKVKPLLVQKCFACHGEDPEKIEGELDLTSRAAMLQGGESGETILAPDRARESLLYLSTTWSDDVDYQMPPKEADRLTEEQSWFLRDWIDAGAPWPDEKTVVTIKERHAEGVIVPTSGGLSGDWTNRRYEPKNLWAYQPLRSEFACESVDAFIDRRLAELALDPAPLADRRTLIRRATFDLLGLPPTPEEVESFVNDPAGDDEALTSVIDRLLESPHYGEQWGRHWLDVVRYADSSGFANDYERGNAWRYRDYVIRAFNADKPYDEFIREQISGDERRPDDPEMRIAVGFLRMGPWELTGMEVAKVARQRFLDDVTDAVGQVFLAQLLQCTRCHDHKFDPIPTRDYYSLQAAFSTTQLAERATPFLDDERTEFHDEQKYLKDRNAFYKQVLQEVNGKRTIEAARKWLADEGRDPEPFEQIIKELADKADGKRVTLDEVRKVMQQREVAPELIPHRHVGFEPQDYGMERVARKGQQRLQWQFDRYEPFALSVYNGRTPAVKSVSAPTRMPKNRMKSGELEQTCILSGGDPFSPGEPVAPGTLSVVNQLGATGLRDFQLPTTVEGRRSALAEWIASPENPLTSRVMVNRIWQGHFGRGIAGNANNFGATGKKPTHPELLDWLAQEFIESGWSVKRMHRVIMLSHTYRRSARHPNPESLVQQDPLGVSYAANLPRRLEAEEFRDATLMTSGELNPQLGGIPVRPEMNPEAALQPRMVMGTFAEAWQPSPRPEQRHRRSIYALRIRGQRDPFLEVFNSPSPDLSCEAREASTVTPQVFALFNSEISYDRALAFANRVLEADQDPRDVIDYACRLAWGRPAKEAEIAACIKHWDAMTARHEDLQFASPEYPREVVREAVEENTGEKFTFREPLEVYADFVPDLKPADASARLRGLAEVCLVLLNSNEFAYVY